MNPSQLWETTLDPNARTLLKVEIKETDEADAIFNALMGQSDAQIKRPRQKQGAHIGVYGSAMSSFMVQFGGYGSTHNFPDLG